MKNSRARAIALGSGAAVVASGTAVVTGQPAEAAPDIVVLNANDFGAGSLRQAIIDANLAPGPDVITFDPGVIGPIILTTGQLAISDSVDIRGPGPAQLAISGNDASRVFYMYSNSATLDVRISGLTITHGKTAANGGGIRDKNEHLVLDDVVLSANVATPSSGGGAAISGTSASLTVTDSVISGNSASNGGGVYTDATAAGGVIQIDSTTITGNTATGKGGGLRSRNAGSVTITDATVTDNKPVGNRGGGMFLYQVAGDVTITDTTVTGNAAASRGAGFMLYQVHGNVTIQRTTVSGNVTASRGGGIFLYKMLGSTTIDDVIVADNTSSGNRGGGIFLYKSTGPVVIEDSTISGNTAVLGGGGLFLYKAHDVSVVNSTVHGNTSNASGGGVYAMTALGTFTVESSTISANNATTDGGGLKLSGATVTLHDAIVADNFLTAGPTPNDLGTGGTFNSSYSLVEAPGAVVLGGTGNVTGVDPQLGPLQNNGGLTKTRLPAFTSPALNTGDPSFLPPPASDQRGGARVVADRIDMGAVEVVARPPGADAHTTDEDVPLIVPVPGVLANDLDAVPSTPATLATPTDHGIVDLAPDGSFTYMPDANYHGSDSFTYTVQLQDGTTGTGTVSIEVVQVIDAPADNAYSTQEDESLVVPAPGVLDNDVDSVAGTVALATGPAHGTVALAPDGSFTYTPDANYHGSDSFTYNMAMLDATTATATVTISVVEVVDFPAASQYVPVSPTRILDTRIGAKPAPGSTTLVPVTGVAGVPTTGVTAVVLNVTATEATAPGFVTVFPTGVSRPTASSLNLEYAGQTIPNLVTVPVGADGTISMYSQSGTHLVADVAGYYGVQTDRKSGRFTPVAPHRLLDTRSSAPLPADGSLNLSVTGVAGVPSSASAVVVNVTATNALARGFISVWPTGLPRPLASSLNVDHANQTIPNLVIVPVGTDGKVSIYSQSGADVIVDITGWYTDSSAPPADDGLFVPVTPTRILDTRPGNAFGNEGNRSVLDGIAAADSAVVLNVTATESTAAGYVTVWPTGEPLPVASNLNVEHAGQTIPNAAIIGVDASGSFDIHAQSATHMIVDLAGYFTLDE